jgi:CheY-like chemotaxis protein
MKKYILLVDDDTEELMIFLDALNKVPGDFKCIYASTPQQAIEILKWAVPDYIFIDFNLPRLNGLQFLSILKTEEKLSHARKFLYSSHISEDLSKMAKVLGATGCIEKTDTIGILAVELRSIFREYRQAG